jgi:threonine-phosphate decarboxylase
LFNSQTPFVLIGLNGGLSAQCVWQSLARDKMLIRRCTNIQGLSDRYIRISLKTAEINRLLASRLIALAQGPETEAGPLKKIQATCG